MNNAVKTPLSNWSGVQAGKRWKFNTYAIHNEIGFDLHYQLYMEIIDWIVNNVNRPFSNARWCKIGDCIYVKMSKSNDLVAFLLKFECTAGNFIKYT